MRRGDVWSRQFTVDERVYGGFLETFNDRNPMHTDAAFASRYGYRDFIMHGNILNGFLSFFVGECLPVRNVVIMRQDIAFVRPVFLGDTVRLEASVADVHESVGSVELKYSFRDGEDRTVARGRILVGVLA